MKSGFVHLDRATRTLCGEGIGSCIGVAYASMLGAFQTTGGRREAAKAAGWKQQRATGASSNRMALGQVDVNAKEAEFEITSFFKLPDAERWEIIRHLQRRYQDDVAVASREALKAEAAARLAQPRQKIKDPHSPVRARCDKNSECIQTKPCCSEADLQALLAVYRKCDPASTRSRTWA